MSSVLEKLTPPDMGFDWEHMGLMEVMDKLEGDVKVIWDRRNRAEIDAARATFDKLVSGGTHTAYKCAREGDRGEVARTFDETAERYILAPRTVGG